MLKYLTAACDVISLELQGGHVVVLDRGNPGFDELEAQGPAPFVPEPEPDPLAVERAGMTCSRFQAKAALMQAGLFDQIEGYMLTNGTAFQKLAWAEANIFTRDSPMIAAIGQLFQLSDTAIDNLFRTAMTVRA